MPTVVLYEKKMPQNWKKKEKKTVLWREKRRRRMRRVTTGTPGIAAGASPGRNGTLPRGRGSSRVSLGETMTSRRAWQKKSKKFQTLITDEKWTEGKKDNKKKTKRNFFLERKSAYHSQWYRWRSKSSSAAVGFLLSVILVGPVLVVQASTHGLRDRLRHFGRQRFPRRGGWVKASTHRTAGSSSTLWPTEIPKERGLGSGEYTQTAGSSSTLWPTEIPKERGLG